LASGVWEAETGFNNLDMTVEVGAGGDALDYDGMLGFIEG
jgi:hypothetical protein